MDATAATLLSLACPAFTAVCLYRSNHRKHRRLTTVVAVWVLGPAALVAPVIGAQHTQGWGVVGWIVNLVTAVACLIHLLPTKLRAKRKRPSPRWLTAAADPVRRPTLTQGSLATKHTGRPTATRKKRPSAQRSTPSKAQPAPHPVLQWGRNFFGVHRPWTPKQRPQALTQHREEIIKAMADEARALGRVDVLEDAMAEMHQAYGGKK